VQIDCTEAFHLCVIKVRNDSSLNKKWLFSTKGSAVVKLLNHGVLGIWRLDFSFK
jgi:hypothetical protein